MSRCVGRITFSEIEVGEAVERDPVLDLLPDRRAGQAHPVRSVEGHLEPVEEDVGGALRPRRGTDSTV